MHRVSLFVVLFVLVAGVGRAQSPQISAGVISASASQSSPTAGDGIKRALAACPTTGGCVVDVDPGYHGVEDLPVPKTDFTSVRDQRNGFDGRIVHNPPLSKRSVDALEIWGDKETGVQSVAAGKWGGYGLYGRTLHLTTSTPGWTLGMTRAGAGGWSGSTIEHLTGDFFGYGIDQGLAIVLENRGIGDKAGEYIYNYCYGGVRAGADEACEGLAMNMGEGASQYAGTVTGPSGVKPGATLIKTFADAQKGQDPGNQGDGRAWVEDAPMASVLVVGMTRSTVFDAPVTLKLDPAHSLPQELVSTAWGTLNAPVAVPQVAEAGGTTSATFDVTILGGAFAARPGDTLCFSGMFHEQAAVTAVQGTRLTALLRHSHSKGSWVTQGGASCSMIDLTANDVARPEKKGQVFDYPFDVLGATDATTLKVTQFFAGQGVTDLAVGNLMLGTTDVNPHGGTVTNQGGTVTIAVDDNVMKQNPALFNQPVVTISGARTASFNGLCKDFSYVKLGTATCKGDPAHSGDADNAVLHIAIGTTPFGNGTATLHRAAEIVDVRNTALENTDPEHVVDGTLMLEANHLLNTVGSTGHIPHDYAEGIHPLQVGSDIYNPYAINYFSTGIAFGFRGAGTRGKAGLNPDSMAAFSPHNMAPENSYLGLGGLAYPPNVVSAKGVFQNMFVSLFAPFPAGSAGIAYGCPPTAMYTCDDQVFSYSPQVYKGFKGEFRDNWTPYTDEYLRKVSGAGTASTFRQTPAGFGFDAPVTATAVATPMYTPRSSTADCPKDHAGKQVVGAVWGDGSYLYQCVAPNKIKRTAALTDF